MQLNSETNGLDLYSDARWWCGIDPLTDTTSYLIKDFTRNANFALDYVETLILKADGWTKFDDTNQTGELLDVSNNLVSGTQKLAIAITWLKIGHVRIKDSGGNWITLPELNRKTQSDGQLTATSGTPSSYFRLGNYIYFDKAPNYSSTGGIEIEFQRGASYFIYTDTAKVPGFATQFHRLISMMPALDYCDLNDLTTRANALRGRIGTPPDMMNGQPGSGMLKELTDYYSMRDTDEKAALKPLKEDYGSLGLSSGNGSVNPKGF